MPDQPPRRNQSAIREGLTSSSRAGWTTLFTFRYDATPPSNPPRPTRAVLGHVDHRHHAGDVGDFRRQTKDQAGNWSGWTTLFTLPHDNQPPLITDLAPAHGAVVTTTARPVISASLSDPTPGSGVQPLSTTFILDSQVVTPQVNTAAGFVYTPTQVLTGAATPWSPAPAARLVLSFAEAPAAQPRLAPGTSPS